MTGRPIVQLLIIDPQNDFCDLPGAALPVPGANADLTRLAALLARRGDAIDAVDVTLDSHSAFDIAHPAWWRDADGAAPAPFTPISVAEVETGRWLARDPARQAQSLAYVRALAERGRYQLLVWPEHCLVGSWGHGVQQALAGALANWSRGRLRPVGYVAKGTNAGTEHYSAIQAEVPDAADAATLPDPRWIARLAAADTILVGGEALSHCVASTVRDLADRLGADGAGKLVLLTDCASPVPGFEAQGQAFIDDMRSRGMRTATSTGWLA
ncbi:cysteine hydrolase [Cupriavidus basilensis]|uniref:Cysteine hydrolase n=1 Tax=Cupriavidus basilensis TaxID=68895 RepID=A0ABT6B2W3_9BURK|nr:cysteine hydrolase [Cupriavidus basilensis]MDF3839220.1 cysteine hydrolase [Cupriavidus basilensis]